MKVNTFSKFGICAGAIALVVGTFAAPAQADPAVGTYGQLVGLGSDTTQDVVNGLAAAITPAGSMASYNAAGDGFTSTVVTRAGGAAVPRANGSSAGRDLLLVAIGQSTTKNIAVTGSSSTSEANKANSVGLVDFARSSSGPSGPTDLGVITYIPFGQDAVTVAVAPTSPLKVVPFLLGSSATESATVPSLYNIYRGVVTHAYVSGLGTTVSPFVYQSVGASSTVPDGAPAGTVAVAIQPYIPQAGSGTRSYFLGKVGLTEGTLNTTVVKDKFGTPEAAVQEHNGSVVANNINAIVPFSISQWVAQANGKAPNRRSGAVLTSMGLTAETVIAPTTGSGTSFVTNSAYKAMVRDVFNIVPSKLADDANSDIAKMFVGPSSKVCLASATIQSFGFMLMPGTTGPTTCGATNQRQSLPSTSDVTLDIADSSVGATDEISVTVKVRSTHNQGGLIEIYDPAGEVVLGSSVLAADTELVSGYATAVFTVKPSKVGTFSVKAAFTPALAGVGYSESSAVEVSVSEVQSEVFISTKKSPKLGAPMNAIVYVQNVALEGGTVVLKSGETTLGTATIEEGEFAASITFTPKALSVPLEATYTPPVGSLGTSDTATKTLTVAKGTPVVTATVASVRATVAPKIKVTVTGMAGVKPTGTITVKNGTTVLTTVPATLVPATGATAATSTVTITLPKQTKGTKSLTVQYSGDILWSTATKTGVVAKITAK